MYKSVLLGCVFIYFKEDAFPFQHFLSFLNCLRVKEFGGAVESLYHFFDRSALITTNEEKSKGFRYAALSLAALHAKFDNKYVLILKIIILMFIVYFVLNPFRTGQAIYCPHLEVRKRSERSIVHK